MIAIFFFQQHIWWMLYLMFSIEFEIKDTTEKRRSASYLDFLLNVDTDGRLQTIAFDKRDDFNV